MAGFATLIELLRQRAAEQPLDLAYRFLLDGENVGESLTYGELDRRARAIAAALRARGAVQGERVLLLFTPGLEFIAAFFGCLYAGAVAVPTYPPRPGRSQPRLTAIAEDADPRWALASAPLLAKTPALVASVPALARVEWIAVAEVLEVPDDAAEDWCPPRLGAEALAFLQYTSGSTAAPKGVMVTHGNLLHNEAVIQTACDHDGASSFVSWLPMYHDMGLIGSVLQPLYLGSPCTLLSPAAFLQSPVRWLRAISTYRAHTSGAPNFAYDLCVRKIPEEERPSLDLSSWQVAFNGAEPVRAETLERFVAAFGPSGFRRQAFFPCYGLAEATLIVSGRRLKGALPVLAFHGLEQGLAILANGDSPEGGRPLVSCGPPGLDQTVAIVEPASGAALPPGRIGEIWVASPSVAAGYWNRPEESRQGFAARLAGEDCGRTFLRTGDLGFLHAGELFVTGRHKDLIILNGRNLYPQDLEGTAEQSHPALRAGGGAAFTIESEGGGEERLVIVQELERRSRAPHPEVAEAIRGALFAEHEVAPWAVVLVRADSVPKTSSGKVQRRACRALYLAEELPVLGESLATAAEIDAAAADGPSGGEIRDVIAATPAAERQGLLEAYLLRQVGGRPGTTGTPLAAFGLDSLRIQELQQRLERDLGCALPLADLFAASDLAALAAEILSELAGVEGEAPAGTVPLLASGETEGDHPMSPGQEALWLADRLAPESAAYNLAAAAIWRGVTAEHLIAGVRELVARHPALRTTVALHDGLPVQRVHAWLEPEIVREDAGGWPTDRLLARVAEEAYRPFDLVRGPLLRVAVFTLGPEEEAVVLAAHHAVADLWSLAIVLRELGTLSDAAPGAVRLPPLPLRYTDAVRWQRARLAGEEGERLWAYWRQRLAGELPALALPTDRPRPSVQSFRGAARRDLWNEERTAGLRALGRDSGATLSMTLLAGLFALLHRATGQEDLLVGSPAAGRESAALEGVVGYFVNPVVVRAEVQGETGFASLLTQIRRRGSEAFAHQGFPLAFLLERLGVARDPGRPPLFQVLFAFESTPFPGALGVGAFALGKGGVRLAAGPRTIETLAVEERRALFDLTLAAAEIDLEQGGGLALSWQFNTDLFDAPTVERLLGHLRTLLAAAVADPARAVADLPLLAAAERHQVLAEWNDSAEALGEPLAVYPRFAAQAARIPSAVAVEAEGEAWTYAELDAECRRLAGALRRLGVGPEVKVGLCLERWPQALAGLLGILAAGGAYVPLDPASPRERLHTMVRDAGVRLVLAEEATAEVFADVADAADAADAGVAVVTREALTANLSAAQDLGGGNPATGLAYVLYTSGSTGRPKGVEISQRSLVNLLDGLRHLLGAGPDDVLLSVTPLTFDIAAVEMFLPLLTGGRLVKMSRAGAADGALLAREIKRSGATLLQATPATWQILREAGWQGSPRLTAISTGETFPPQLARWLAPRTARLWNAYGPTETTIYSAVQRVRNLEEQAGRQGAIPIGRPVANTRLHLLDRQLQPVPLGIVGELYIGGLGLARDYHGRPERTAAAFLPDPLAGEPGARLYRTGDLARRLPGGELDFLGRADGQVKVRGFRIELGEIEAALGSHPAVARAVAVVREDRPGDRRLTAYAVLRAGGSDALGSDAALLAHLRERLPAHAVPAAIVLLPALPLTPSGKLDRRHLPPPPSLEAAGPAGLPPRGPVEESLAAIWCEVLGVERLSADDNFFALGGHSLLAARVLARVREAFGSELPLSSLFAAPTVASLAQRIAAARGRPPVPRISPRLSPRPRGVELPLSAAQARLWFLHQMAPASAVYNLPLAMELSGPLQAGALVAACAALVRRHEALRTTICRGDNGPLQKVSPDLASPLHQIDLTAVPEPRREEIAERLTAAEVSRPFDLEIGPPVRFVLLGIGDEGHGRHRLLLTVHHIVADGGSLRLLGEELAVLYGERATGGPPLPAVPLQLGDFVLGREGVREPEEEAVALDYWRRQLAGVPAALELPEDHPRPPVQSFAGAWQPVPLSPALVAALDACGRRLSATRFMVLLAGFAALLHRHSGQECVVVGSPFAVAGEPLLERAVGLFIETQVLPVRLAGAPGFGALVERARETCLGAHEHRRLPFERLVPEIQGERDLSRNPLFQALFAFDRAPVETSAGGVTFRPRLQATATAKVDLSLYAVETPGGLETAFEYATALFSAPTIARLARHLPALLAGALAEPDCRVAEIPLLAAGERAQLLVEWNDTGIDRAQREDEDCLHDLIAHQAARTPDAVAVSSEGGQWTYAALTAATDRLARHLAGLGVGPESVVAICAERSWGLMVGLLGILKAGGAYLPLDAEYPEERLLYMLGDSGATVLLTDKKRAGRLAAAGVRQLFLDAPGLASESLASGPPPLRAHPDGPAYVIYTSGSTGRPKGVVVAHRGICNRLLWMQETYRLTAEDRVLQKTPIGFDVSVWELFWPLLTGSCLVLARPGGHHDPTYLARTIGDEEITTLHFVPSMLGAFLAEEDLSGCASLARVVCSGEALPVELVERFFTRLGRSSSELHNLYGPTEAAVDVTAWRCSPPGGERRIPIGRPISGMRTLVLDAAMELAPLGVPGQLHLGGVGLARGYLGRPELTAERFVPAPWSGVPGERLYQTGDLVRCRPDGGLDFLGRIDHQTKIRGFRIELGEIEVALARHPAIAEAVVVAAVAAAGASSAGDRRLVAYLVSPLVTGSEASVPPATSELRAFLGHRLPEFMIPASFVFLSRLPLSTNGKVDRRALPAPMAPASEQPALRTGFVAPRGPIEEALAAVWSRVLGVDPVGVHDNFFELGGDSIRSIQVRSLARGLGLDLSLPQLFAHRTIAELAREVRKTAGDDAVDAGDPARTAPFGLLAPTDRVRLEADFEDAFPLSRLQEGLVFHSEYSADYEVYITRFRLRGRFDAAALRATLRRLVRRHPMLRTSFDLTGFAEPIQRVARKATVPLLVTDLRGLEPGERERRLAAWEEGERRHKFAWDRAPLVRVHVHPLDDRTFHVAFVHSILDGWSMALLTTELFSDYAERMRGEAPVVPPAPALSYRDFVALERSSRQSAETEAFWTERLRGAVRTQLPRLRPALGEGEALHARRPREVPAASVAGLERVARSLAVPFKSALLAAHLRVLGLLAGTTDVVAGLLANGRPEETDGDRILGLFLNAVPFRFDLSGGTWEDLVRRAFATERELLPHRRFPLAELHRKQGGAMFETVFNFTHFHVFSGLVGIEGIEVVDAVAPSDQTYFPLTLYLNRDPVSAALFLAIDYDRRELDDEQVERIIGYHLAAFAALAAEPEGRHDACCLLAPAERSELLAEGDRSRAELPEELLVHQRVEAQVARTPRAPAVLQGDRSLSYGELDRRADRLARHLRRLGVGPEARVGLCLPRTPDLLVAVLAVWKAGGAYVPLDPAYPRERLAFMLADSGARLLVTVGGLADGLAAAGCAVLDLEALAAVAERVEESSEPLPPLVSPALPASPAYVIYTSGSTGRPKGVVVPHRGVVNFLLSMQREPGLGADDLLLAVTSLSFDIAVLELLLPLTVGARVLLAGSAETADGSRLVALLGRASPTVLQATPATWRLLLEAGWEGTPGLVALCGGEALPRDLAAALVPRTAALWNLYGPTETTIWSSVHRVTSGSGEVPLGHPIANTSIHLLDSHLLPAPLGTPGEVFLGGEGVVRGYVGRPDLTAERFLPDPFSGEPGKRLYRTGDLARRLPAGEIEFLGRLDHQVKVRGFRIELGEIAAVLAEHPGVREAAVIPRAEGAGDVRLVACVVLAPGEPGAGNRLSLVPRTGDWLREAPEGARPQDQAEPVSAAELRAFLRRRLPEHMLPAAFVTLSALPLTANRKLDRQALAAAAEQTPPAPRSVVGPRDAMESELARMWSEVLGLPEIGVEDDFFELGGHSLLALRLTARIRKRFARELPLSALFKGATVARLAALLRQEPAAASATMTASAALVEIQPLGNLTPFFCVHPVGGGVLCYAELARHLGPDQPLFGLQAPELAGGSPLRRIEDRADSYIAALRRVQPAGPYRLGGWSMGGVIAFEMARQLAGAGETVDLVAVLDAACPAGPGTPVELAETALEEWFARDARAAGILAAEIEPADVQGLYELFKANLAAIRDYIPQPYPGALLLVRAAERPLVEGDGTLGWGRLAAGGVSVHVLAADHYTLLRPPQVGFLAALLGRLFAQDVGVRPDGDANVPALATVERTVEMKEEPGA